MAVYAYGTVLVLLVCVDCVQAYGPPIGCYKDWTPRAMDDATRTDDRNGMTFSVCAQHCQSTTSYTFLGLQAGYACFCGNSYDRYGSAPESECDTHCRGAASQMCGGNFRNSVYQVCPANKWGDNCDQECDCVGTDVCMRSSGSCVPPCLDGWLGTSCDIPDCSNNNGDCDHNCNQNTSRKWCSCNPGYILGADGKTCTGLYIGCYSDKILRVMNESTQTNDKAGMKVSVCVEHCRGTTTYTFIGIQAGFACFCGDTYDTYGSASQCNAPCPGEASDMCGGTWKNSVYQVCPSNKWGDNCDKQCGCVGTDVCMRSSGTCVPPCRTGWLGASCDIPDCSNNNGDCDQNCNQNTDSKWCSCDPGYRLDGKTCPDLDECEEGSHNCSAGYDFCQNSNGTYSCSCPEGYGLRNDTHTCADIDECAESLHQCSAGDEFCHNSNGSYTCSCPDGYGLQNDTHTCADIDECAQGVHQCSAGDAFCQNNEGSYSCSCPEHYRLGNDTITCEDIDECGEGSHQCSAGDDFCHNSVGTYSCSCPAGYRLQNNNTICADIDECDEGVHQCSVGDDFCQNSEGSYTCSCPEGYGLQNDTHTCAESLSPDTPVPVVVVPVILVIIVIALIAVAIVLFRRGVFGRRCTSTEDKRSSLNPPDILNAAYVHKREDAETILSNTAAYASTGITFPPSMKIPFGDLESHIERLSNQNGIGLQKEFAQILDNKRGSSHVARAPALKDMNRFKNILPYDHNRVVLLENITYGASDYINASYIKIKDKIEYIATQDQV